MKKLSALLVALLCTAALWAQAPATASTAGQKVGVINIQQAILATTEGKAAEAALTARFQPKRAELEKSNQDILALQQKLKAGGNTLSATAKSDLTEQITTKQRDLQRAAEDAQSDYQQAQGQLVNQVGSKMMPIITKYAQDHGYSVILDISFPWPQNPVLFANDSANVTNDIVKLYDQAHPSSASAPASKTP
jgi:outer membrane protein